MSTRGWRRAPEAVTRYFEAFDGLRWYLTREEDQFGNTVNYYYQYFGAAKLLTRVEYGENRNAGLQPHVWVSFTWEPLTSGSYCGSSSLPIGAYIDRGIVSGSTKLTQILTQVKDDPSATLRDVRKTTIGYDPTPCNGSAAPVRYLTSITEEGRSPSTQQWTQLPTMTFGYSAKERRYDQKRTISWVTYPEQGIHGSGITDAAQSVMQMDIDDDGLVDQVQPVEVQLPPTSNPDDMEVVCGLEVRRGVVGGGFVPESAKTVIKLPTARWKDGRRPNDSEKCTLFEQSFQRTLDRGNNGCSRVDGPNKLKYHFLDWDADGRLDLLTDAWVLTGRNMEYEIVASPSDGTGPAPVWQFPGGLHNCPNPSPGVPERATEAYKWRWRVYAGVTGAARTVTSPWWFGSGSGGGEELQTLVDMDGDGYLDVVHLSPTETSLDPVRTHPLSYTGTLVVHLGHGGETFGDYHAGWSVPAYTPAGLDENGRSPSPQDFGWKMSRPTARLIDFNADGLPDLIMDTQAGLQVALNTGRGFATPIALGISGPIEKQMTAGHIRPTDTATHMNILDGARTYVRRLFDVDGDHRPDLVDFPLDANHRQTGEVYVRFNMGAGFLAATSVNMPKVFPARNTYDSLPVAAGATSAPWQVANDLGDADGDGLTDLSMWNGLKQDIFTDDLSTAPPRVLVTIRNGRGAVTTFNYASSNNAAVREDASSSAIFTTNAPMWVVSSMTADPGAEQPAIRTQYRYAEPKFGRKTPLDPVRFVGFGRIRTIGGAPSGSSGGKETVQRYDLRPETGQLELNEEIVYAREAGGLRPAVITQPILVTKTLFNGSLAVRLPDSTITWTCLTTQTTEDACRSAGTIRRSVQTWLPSPASGPAKLYLLDTSENTRRRVQPIRVAPSWDLTMFAIQRPGLRRTTTFCHSRWPTIRGGLVARATHGPRLNSST